MDDLYEQRLFSECFLKIVNQTNSGSKLAKDIAAWFIENSHELGVNLPDLDDLPQKSEDLIDEEIKSLRAWTGLLEGKKPTRRSWQTMCAEVEHVLFKTLKAKPSLLERNLVALSKDMCLTKVEHSILGMAIRYRTFSRWDSLIDVVWGCSGSDIYRCVSTVTGHSLEKMIDALGPKKNLYSSGLLSFACGLSEFLGFADRMKFASGLATAVLPPKNGIEQIREALFGKTVKPTLKWSDFEHISPDRDFLVRLLKGAARRRDKGINILFYGPPGTGKTELCRVLADQVGLNLYAVGEQDSHGNEPSSQERISTFLLAQAMLKASPNTALLFDEMEDLLTSVHSLRDGTRSVQSKIFINRLLENNAIPAFWTVNRVSDFDPALLRRMTCAVELKVPTQPIRERVWSRLLNKNKILHSKEAPSILAREFPEAPSLASNAVRAAKIAGGGMEDIRHSVRRISAVMNGGTERRVATQDNGPYALELINADLDLSDVVTRLKAHNQLKFSLCLGGPSGTGKSAYVRRLAQELGIEVLHKRTSDLLNPFVGGTERRIARAFQEARSTGGFLVFDEADSLLYDRRTAQRSWEVTAVNEMLTWMEGHDLPFACTTNLNDRLDPASLRRFTFKVMFDYLKPDQVGAAFKLYFGIEAPRQASELVSLAPGDFSVVRRKAEILGHLKDPNALVDLLRQETQGRHTQQKIGFCMSGATQ